MYPLERMLAAFSGLPRCKKQKDSDAFQAALKLLGCELSMHQRNALAESATARWDSSHFIYRSKGPCDVFDPWVRWERGQVGI